MSTHQERSLILQMVERGDISPEEGADLLLAVGGLPRPGKTSDEDALPDNVGTTDTVSSAPVHLGKKIGVIWYIPIWIGVGLTILGAYLLFISLDRSGIGVWFGLAGMLFLFGIGVIVLAWQIRNAPTLNVVVRQKNGKQRAKFTLGIPLPVKFATWTLKVFRGWIPSLQHTQVEELLHALETTALSHEGFSIYVDNINEGEEIQIYLN